MRRGNNAPALLATAGTADHEHLRFAHAEGLGEKALHGGIGLAVHGRRLNAHFQGIAMKAGKFAAAGTGLGVDGQQHIGTIALDGGVTQAAPTNASAVGYADFTRISKIWIARKAMIGDRSKPPMLGNRRRHGARMNSES